MENRRLIDLTHILGGEISRFGGLPAPMVRPWMSHKGSAGKYAPGCSFEISEITAVTSVGTYLDAPRHRYPEGEDIASLGLERLSAPGVLLDLQGVEAGEAITGADIRSAWPSSAPEGCAALIWTGWDRHWNTGAYQNGPFLTKDAAEALLGYGCGMVGVDTLNIDSMDDPERPVHSLLLGSNCLIVENLANLGSLKGLEFVFAALPAPVRGAASFPVRAVAICF